MSVWLNTSEKEKGMLGQAMTLLLVILFLLLLLVVAVHDAGSAHPTYSGGGMLLPIAQAMAESTVSSLSHGIAALR